MYDFLIVESRNDIGLVTLNRPDVLNAWHSAMRQELASALTSLNEDPTIGAVVLTGAGNRAFSAGQDLNEAKSFHTERAAQWIEEWRTLYGAIRGMPMGPHGQTGTRQAPCGGAKTVPRLPINQ